MDTPLRFLEGHAHLLRLFLKTGGEYGSERGKGKFRCAKLDRRDIAPPGRGGRGYRHTPEQGQTEKSA